MKFLLYAVVLFLSFILGAVGFPQIVGTLKYFGRTTVALPLFTITLWLLILSGGFFVVIKWLNDYSIALYIGYGVSFLLSLGTKPD